MGGFLTEKPHAPFGGRRPGSPNVWGGAPGCPKEEPLPHPSAAEHAFPGQSHSLRGNPPRAPHKDPCQRMIPAGEAIKGPQGMSEVHQASV